MSKVVLNNISRIFGDFKAVDNLSMEMQEGELVSLLGPSGCGKTTTLRMIAGFIPPSDGTIVVDDKVISSASSSLPPEHRNMSMIFQSYAIWPNMTVAENVAFGLKIRKLPSSEIESRVNEILKVVQLYPMRDRYPAELSGGQQQRVSLARSIVVKPSVLLLDEPLSNLDANLREEMRFEIRRLHDEFQMTMVYVTHDQAEAMVTSDRIAVMNKGRIEQLDKPYDLYARPKTRFVAGFIGRTNFIKGQAQGDGFDFKGFSLPRSSLDDVPANADKISVSIRPQCIHLHEQKPAAADQRFSVPATLRQRSYLGESWDYQIAMPGIDELLRVTARPQEVFEVGQQIYAEIETRQLTIIEE